jgi:hypothetical protein
MTSEEKILSYLDGSLTDNESAELLHSLSVSPEKRIVLEQHIQLRDIAASAQRPFAVPASVEEELAAKIPVIARYNREMATGIIASSAVRQNFIIRGAIAIGSFIVRYPAQVSTAALVVSLLGGYLFFSGSGTATNQNTNIPNVINTPIQQASVNAPEKGSHELTSNNSSPALTGSVIARPETRNPPGHHNTISSGTRSLHAASTTDHNVSFVNEKKEDMNSSANNRSSSSVNSSDVPAAPLNSQQLAEVGFANSFRSENQNVHSINGGQQMMQPYGPRKSYSNVPLLIRGDFAMGQAYVRVNSSDASSTARVENQPILGLDYIASPYFSFGGEAGKAGISQVIPQTVVDQKSGVARVVSSNTIESSNHFFTRALVRYTPNPYDMIRLEASAGGGVAFYDGGVPLVAGSLMGTYSLSEVVGFSVGVLFSGTFTKTATSSGADQQSFQSDLPIAYVQQNTAASSLFTPSVTFRLGLRIKPW